MQQNYHKVHQNLLSAVHISFKVLNSPCTKYAILLTIIIANKQNRHNLIAWYERPKILIPWRYALSAECGVVMFKVNGTWWGNSKATGSLCCQPQIQNVKNPFFTSFCDKSNDKSPKCNKNGTKRWNMHQWQKKLPLDQITVLLSTVGCTVSTITVKPTAQTRRKVNIRLTQRWEG